MGKTATVVVSALVLWGCMPSESTTPGGVATSGGDAASFSAGLAQLRADHEKERKRLERLQASNVALEAAQEEERRQLQGLKAEADKAERRAAEARKEATFQQCSARVAALGSAAMREVAECMKQDAEYQKCDASKSKGGAGGTIVGCGLAMLFAPATMGASLVGCGGGWVVGTAMAGKCGEAPPECPADRVLLAQVLADEGIPALPMCGGAIGITLEDASHEVYGWSVSEVLPGSLAAEMEVAVGDVIVRVGDTDATPGLSILDVVRGQEAGAPLTVEVVRESLRLRRTGNARDERQLGVRTNREPEPTKEIVLAVRSSERPELVEGDLVLGVGGGYGAELELLRDAIRLARPGKKVTVDIIRGMERKEVTVELTERSQTSDL